MLRKLLADCRGNIATTFAIASLPVIAAMGAAVDYSRSYDERQTVQDALDSAVLAAGKKIGTLTTDQLKTEANNFYMSNIAGKLTKVPLMTTTIAASTIVGTAQLRVPTYFLGIVGLKEIVFNVKATATLAMGTLEVALVLDNSTSMAGSKISTLKTAANDLVTTLYNLAATSTKPDPVKVALVPFGASVNVGSQYSNAAWLDTGGKGTYNSDAMKASGAASTTSNLALFTNLKDTSGKAITWGGCVEERPAPYDVDDTPATGASSPTSEEKKTLFVPMFAPDEPDNWTCSTSDCAYAGSSSSKRRYNGAPDGSQSYNNYLPDAGDSTTCPTNMKTVTSASSSTDKFTVASADLPANGTQVVFQSTNSLPGGISATTTYYVVSASGSTFKVSTSSGGSAVNLTSGGSGTLRFSLTANWTCSNGSANCDSSGVGKSETTAFGGQNISAAPLCKYGSATGKATVQDISLSGFTGGPNFMCTTQAITPLTTTKSTITNAINAQAANGYTNITAGVMWGWRVLSPGAPFTDGRAYSDNENQKILILMTDGANTYLSKNNFLKSLYSAWGYIKQNHLDTTSSDDDDVVEKMEGRMAEACKNVKAAKVKIYTVAFQITDETTLGLLASCASKPENAYQSSDNASLLAAFKAIGDDISLLRVSE